MLEQGRYGARDSNCGQKSFCQEKKILKNMKKKPEWDKEPRETTRCGQLGKVPYLQTGYSFVSAFLCVFFSQSSLVFLSKEALYKLKKPIVYALNDRHMCRYR